MEQHIVDPDFLRFIELIRLRTGIDLSLYKEAQMKRRLTTLREKKGFHDFYSYGHALLRDAGLLEEFLDRMTINVSEFFRNANRWEIVEQIVIPNLLKERNTLKVWSAACSTGEEPYTLTMILLGMAERRNVTLLATDIDQKALDKAKLGVYSERSLRELPARYRKYFRQDGVLYYLSDEVKSWVQYRQHNLFRDMYDRDYDLIICRNAMIYFTESAKIELCNRLSNSLRRGGYLFTGSTEQIFHPEDYGLITDSPFIYRKK